MITNDNLLALNERINEDVEVLEKKPISSLILNKAYVIKKMFMLNTRFGKSILVNLFNTDTNTTFKSFLPKRIAELLNVDLIEEVNSSDGKYALIYLGQSPSLYVGAKSRSLIKFEIISRSLLELEAIK